MYESLTSSAGYSLRCNSIAMIWQTGANSFSSYSRYIYTDLKLSKLVGRSCISHDIGWLGSPGYAFRLRPTCYVRSRYRGHRQEPTHLPLVPLSCPPVPKSRSRLTKRALIIRFKWTQPLYWKIGPQRELWPMGIVAKTSRFHFHR